MNQAAITPIVRDLFEKRFFALADWLSNTLRIPPAFLRHPVYPGMSVAVNGQRVLDFNFVDRTLHGETGDHAGLMNATNEAACFAPYLARRGPMVTIDAGGLAAESSQSGVPEEALLEILVLHEMVHVCMMGYISQRPQSHAWITDARYRYIHEAVALKASEFGMKGLLQVATPQHIERYLAHIQAVANDRGAGPYYLPYFDTYRALPLDQFWPALRSSQPVPGIFEEVEGLA